MVVLDLLRELEGRGVHLSVDGGRLVAHAPQGAVTPELAAQIKAQKDALLKALQGVPSGHLAPLPDILGRMVRAAVSPGLNYPAQLPGGMVTNLGEYVLASAALYAAGLEPERQLQSLWAARGAWMS